jgi:hypothetical protein
MTHKRKHLALVAGILMVGLFIQHTYAQDAIGPNAVTGKEYTCFFYAPLDIFNGEMAFGPQGGLTISSFGGYGIYLPLGNAFTGAYWSLNSTIGEKRGDLILLMVGGSFDPFIFGAGVMIIEYAEVYPFVFSGFQAAVQ